MSNAPAAQADLDDWLDYIAAVNPREIELGLERVGAVAHALDLDLPDATVITVAGTNGKGTCVAALEALAMDAGLQVGCYISPHIHHFSERIRINTEPVSDRDLITALHTIDAARGDIPLSYFEFATLAGLLLFRKAGVELIVLEVGLGGRLDAVNIVSADVAVITSISLDHTDWLGDDREQIGVEKAGIMRRNKPVVVVDPQPPEALLDVATELQAPLLLLGRDFSVTDSDDRRSWTYSGRYPDGSEQHLATIPRSGLRPDNLAAAVQAMTLALGKVQIKEATLGALTVPGRQEWRRLADGQVRALFDVAHNPAATAYLAERLAQLRGEHGFQRVAVVLAVMADKDIDAMIASLQSVVDIWYIAQVDEARCKPAQEVAQIVSRHTRNPITSYQDLGSAFSAAQADTGARDLLVVTGSFYTVAAMRGKTRPAREHAGNPRATRTDNTAHTKDRVEPD